MKNSSHLTVCKDGTDSVPKRQHINSDAGELLRRNHTTFRTRL